MPHEFTSSGGGKANELNEDSWSINTGCHRRALKVLIPPLSSPLDSSFFSFSEFLLQETDRAWLRALISRASERGVLLIGPPEH